MLITDKGVANSVILDNFLTPLKAAEISVSIFDEVEYNPTVHTVDKAVEQFKGEGCEGIIGVGGLLIVAAKSIIFSPWKKRK